MLKTTKYRPLSLSITVVVGAFIMAQSAQAQNLVQDPGFEDSTGSATSPGWVLGTSGGFTNFVNNSDVAHTGNWSATFGDVSPVTLSQIIETVPETTYLVSFFLRDDGNGSGKNFTATFDGQTVASLTNPQSSPYTLYSGSVVATSSQSTLAFTGQNPPSQYYLDDVSVEAAPVPLPGAGGLSLIAGAAMLAGSRWRRARRKLT